MIRLNLSLKSQTSTYRGVIFSRPLQYLLFIILALILAPVQANNQPESEKQFTVGFTRSVMADPMGGEMHYAVWYPSNDDEGMIELGPFKFPGTQDAKPAVGKFGLVILSHGSEGTYLGHHNIAIALARQGVIAVTPLHPRDNYRDGSGTGHRIVWDGRPKQISALIDRMLADTQWSTLIAPEKVGVFGFSLGGYTVLSLLGAKHDLKTMIAHCNKNLKADPFCQLRGGLSTAMQGIYDAEYAGKAPVASHYDARISAALIADPVAAVFSEQSLAALADIPISLYMPEYGNELAGAFHGGRLVDVLARQQRKNPLKHQQVSAAKHMSFLAPFPMEVARTIPGLLDHAEGFEWKGFQQHFAQETAQFFVEAFVDNINK